jgi:small subunit ribosomal protein S12e
MACRENVAAPVEVDVEAVEEVAKPAEPLDMTSALKLVMKKALAHDGLARGLHEACRAIEKDQAQLCVLAEDCNQPDYKKLIEGLCAEKGVDLVRSTASPVSQPLDNALSQKQLNKQL